MNLKRLISLLLFICFSIYLGHNLIPHHHHAEVAGHPRGGDCPVDHKDHCNPQGHPLHCHAFNNLDFVKYDQSVIKQPVKLLSELLTPLSPGTVDEPDAALFLRYALLKQPDITLRCFGATPMRAPPFSA